MTDKPANIYTALCAAQASMGKVVKGATNPAFKSKYADLADVVAVVVPALTEQGIAMLHTVTRDEYGLNMRTALVHGESDTSIFCDVPLIVDRQNMQGMKSATTYAKRIGVESLTGIAPEDDDGNAAVQAALKGEVVDRRAKPEPMHPDAAQVAIDSLTAADTLAALQAIWTDLPPAVRGVAGVIAAKDARKAALQAPANADLGGDAIPY
jgi:hypothetical protein